MAHRRLVALTATALVASALCLAPTAHAATPSPSTAAVPPPTAAADRLHAEADKTLTTHSQRGVLRFAGVSGGHVENPTVDSGDSVTSAARSHLARYGAAFGADRAGTRLVTASSTHTTTGGDVVRLDQHIDGVPVLGGQVVVAMHADRSLASLASSLSTTTNVSTPRVTRGRAQALALAVSTRAEGHQAGALRVSGQGRAIFDPAVFGAASAAGGRSGWRFEVTSSGGVRRLVLIDDQDGRVLLDIDQDEHLDRAVCDNAGAVNTADVPCTTPQRTESSGATGDADADSAFDLAGQVATFYSQVGNLDLTSLIGLTQPDGRKSLAATVNWCYTAAEGCPYDDAFWNGTQMYYGHGFAGADDVVGHEMTHGVIDQFSQLFYWGQSGAINESLADTIGEIIDHRNGPADEDNSAWDLGEDLPGGAQRSMKDPALHAQPDTMTSPTYYEGLEDNGGVHTDSGVGNRTAYLVSQGGTFNGTTFSGIDAGDPTLTKTATLYVDVLEKLTSGAEYADLAAQLEQSCSDLVTAHKAGFTTADCADVHLATEVTQLRTNPTAESTRTDAAIECPVRTTPRVLLDSETGDAPSKFTSSGAWTRDADPYWGPNATSGKDAWNYTMAPSSGTTGTGIGKLTATAGVALPAGQQAYLWFRQWYLLDYDSSGYYDGGIVGWTDDTTATTYWSGTGGWVNGPNHSIASASDNPEAGKGKPIFGGDSRGWVASRKDLSAYAGHTIRPYFELARDSFAWYVGWFLDDIKLYTCDPLPLPNTVAPKISGTVRVGSRLTATPGTWSPAATSVTYQWLRNGSAISGATASTYTLAGADYGSKVSVKVTATSSAWTGGKAGTKTSAATAAVALGPALTTTTAPKITGTVRVGSKLSVSKGTWSQTPTRYLYTWIRDTVPVDGSLESPTYTVKPADVGMRITVRVTAVVDGWEPGNKVTAPVGPVLRGLITAVTPTITGTRQVGHTLSATYAGWEPSGVHHTFRWYRNGVAIKGATGSTYRLAGTDRGKRVSVHVSGTKAGYTTVTVGSVRTAVIR